MTKDLTDMELADDLDAQLKLITEAYARDGDAYEVDLVLSHVSWVRRMKRKGWFELFAALDDDDEDADEPD
ncbi:hypothetical protein [Aliiroseovarius sediminis]|uniref:hypothetical protein n=1 Tax=Aliiroseovarius sediminis TaxID=2925839 RepID=UPI001F59408D|nr:hypothetical protein [Aliiroseovarius sediminis]MCI2395723.1 hypothetical protein [Aliiroseovarius sediminis]